MSDWKPTRWPGADMAGPHPYSEDPYSNARPALCRCGMAANWVWHQPFWKRTLMRLTGQRWAK